MLRAMIIVTVLSALLIASAHSSLDQYFEDLEETLQINRRDLSKADENSPSVLERAHWCRTINGTYLPFGFTFMSSVCSMCRCTTSHAIRCTTLQCMPTYCIDNTMPYRKADQCCAQCGYELSSSSCVYNNITFPHGTLIKTVDNKMQCWCQSGDIECRSNIGLLFESLDFWNDNSAIYIIVVILCVVLIFGILMCCSCTLFYYYYFKNQEQAMQQAYEQYVGSAGWQPMDDTDQYGAEYAAEEKQYEAENGQFVNFHVEGVPPPYGVHNSSFIGAKEGQQK